jgi:hypothetical protein
MFVNVVNKHVLFYFILFFFWHNGKVKQTTVMVGLPKESH